MRSVGLPRHANGAGPKFSGDGGVLARLGWWLLHARWAAFASAVYAWCVVVAPAAFIAPSLLLLLVPPALVSSLPLVVAQRDRSATSFFAAVTLIAWCCVGITLLGPFFLPSAALLYAASRRKGDRSSKSNDVSRGA